MKQIALLGTVLVMLAGCAHRQEEDHQSKAGASANFDGTAPPTTARATAPPQSEEPLNNIERADKLINEPVLSSDHLRAGKVDDFVIDQDSGQILYSIVGVGGIIGLGETRVAVPPELFAQAKKGSVELKVDRAKLNRAPRVIRETEKTVKADFLNHVYGYYGQRASWQRASASPVAAFPSARKASEIKGMTVRDTAGQDLGTVEAVVLQVPTGRELYTILAPAAALNLGSNFYALPPQALKLGTDNKELVANITRDKLSASPHFAKNDWPQLADTAWAHRVYQYYGQSSSFPIPELQPTGRTNRTDTSDSKSNHK